MSGLLCFCVSASGLLTAFVVVFAAGFFLVCIVHGWGVYVCVQCVCGVGVQSVGCYMGLGWVVNEGGVWNC